jgi:hypothetical protein
MLKVSLVVLAQGPDDRMISEETRTVTVSAHGALVLMTAKVSVGQLLTLRNSTTDEEVLCRVAYVNTHVGEKKEVGLDFMKPRPRFWRISFPPPDLTTRSPEAKSDANPRLRGTTIDVGKKK